MSGGYQLIQLKNGSWSVRSIAEGETFHPVVGPVAEAEALYVRQLRLADRAAGTGEPFVLWDIGLGAAANVLTALRALRVTARRVEVVSFDHTLAPLEFALSNATVLGYVEGFELAIQTLLEQRSVEFTQGPMTVSWRVVEGDFPTLAAEAGATDWPTPHGILFDAFSPARNPAMWTLPLFRRLRELASPDRPCALATYSRATLVRVTLLLAGWQVGVGHATGEKDETTVAANRPDLIAEPLDREWLLRARRSTSAEPLHTAQYCQQPLSEPSWDALLRLPQFQPSEPTESLPATGPASPG